MPKSKTSVGFDLMIEGGHVGKPSRFSLWNNDKNSKKPQAHAPLKYYADALIGTTANLLKDWQHPAAGAKNTSSENPFWKAWTQMEAHYELYTRSNPRVESLRAESPASDKALLKKFEDSFSKALNDAFSKPEIDFRDFEFLIDKIEALENDFKQPLLYNFSMNFSKNFADQLQVFYSFLWNLRSLVAVDYNAHMQDVSHEGLKVDSVSDYLPKPDYVANDAILYYQFKKLITPFTSGRQSDVRIEKLFAEPLKKAFHQYSHNASYLIDHLPEKFLSSLNPYELEEALHLVQMDWLLASPSGCLFKIREELYGLQSGYEKIFWLEAQGRPKQKTARFEVSCSLQTGNSSKDVA